MAIWDGSCAFVVPLAGRCRPAGIGGRSRTGRHGVLGHGLPSRLADASWDFNFGGAVYIAASLLYCASCTTLNT